MSLADVATLVELARAHDDQLVDRWGSSSVWIDADIDLSAMHDVSLLTGYTVTAYFGERREPLRLGVGLPDQTELATVSALAPNERVRAEVAAATSGTEAAELLAVELVGVEVKFARRGWVRTERALHDAVTADWVAVAGSMPTDAVHVGSEVLSLVPIALATGPGSLPVIVPAEERTNISAVGLWELIWRLADAAAWTRLAVAMTRSADAADVALHSDQKPNIPVTLESAGGGTSLYRWWLSDSDGNREEALRHVFRVVTAASQHVLPDARTVQTLAERQRIALTRDRAAEVLRAIADGNRDTEELLESSTRALAELTENTTNTANATVVAVLGVVALVGRTSDTLPPWLVVVATCAAIGGLVAVVLSRRRRIADQETAATRLVERLANDPLLPEDDRSSARATINDFDLTRRARHARRTIGLLGSAACGVALAAAVWLVWIREPQPISRISPSPSSTTRPQRVSS